MIASILTAMLALTPMEDEVMLRLPPIDQSARFDAITYENQEFEPFVAGLEDEVTLPGTQLNMTWLASGEANGFGLVDVDANHTWLLGYDDWPPLTITPGFGIHFWAGPKAIDLPPRVYDAYLDFQWRPIQRERWGLSLGVIPGWYGDFELWDNQTFQLTGWMVVDYRIGDDFHLLGGLAYTRQLRSNLLPVGGVIWTPTDDTRVEIMVPKSKIARRILSSDAGTTWCYVAGQLAGGIWAVADTPDSNVLVAYNDLRLVVGLESFRHGGYECSFEVGYIFARDISVDDFSIYSPEDTVMLQATFAF